jgi:molybdopterin converting factor small subunit
MATSDATNGDAVVSTTNSGDTIEELTKEVESLKKKLEEERAKFNDVECKIHVLNSIFSIASSNSFYSELYAKLFKILMEEYEVFKKIFEDNYKVFMNLFDNIEYADPKKNYDKFCEYTKTNDNRRAMSLFIVNLMKNGVIEKEEILEIIKNLQKLIMKYITKPDKTNEVEELNENLYIIITNSSREIKFGIDDGTENIIKCIEFISILKPKMKEYPSITNKTIFKHMDIITEIK